MDPNSILREYLTEEQSPSPRPLVILFGVWDKYLRIKLLTERQSKADYLYLKDPNGVFFCLGSSKHKSVKQESQKDLDPEETSLFVGLKEFLLAEIEERQPSQVVLISSCVNGLVTLNLGFQIAVDRVYVFSPWTHIPEPSHYLKMAETTPDNNDVFSDCRNKYMFKMAAPKYHRNPELFTSLDLNIANPPAKTQSFLYFGAECPLDLLYRDHLTPESHKKMQVLTVPGAKNLRETIYMAGDQGLLDSLLELI